MSLLLSSLKKADEENQKSSGDTAAPAEGSPSVAPAASSAGAGLGIAPSASTPEALAPAAGAVDFDSIEDSTGGDDSTTEKELVGATRVFRAGGEESEGGGRRALYIVGTLVVVFGGGFGLVASGLIPGVSTLSLLGLLGTRGVEQAAVVAPTSSGPVLQAVQTAGAVSLPLPQVDVQADVDYASFQLPDTGLLDTAAGRREFAEKLAILTGVDEEEEGEISKITAGLVGLDGLDGQDGLDDGQIEETEEGKRAAITTIKTAAVSRERKHALEAKTPSDRLLGRAVKISKNGIAKAAETVAQVAQESDGESAANASNASDEVRVAPSLSGIDRRRLLKEASGLYIGGQYAEAEAVYRGILIKSATNVDALRGLALVEVATGRYQLAASTYLQILEYYPNDPVAIADLTNLHGVSGDNFYAIEGALKKAVGKRPEWDSRLYFALGNLYAGGGRWLDAQKSYFKAYGGEQSNPDYAYNLAVVLDYLNKPSLAVKLLPRGAVSSPGCAGRV